MNAPLLIFSVLMVIVCAVLLWRLLVYRSLCVKLTKVVKAMYCKEPGCHNYRYNTTPIEGEEGHIPGYMSDYCALHLSEKIERENGQ